MRERETEKEREREDSKNKTIRNAGWSSGEGIIMSQKRAIRTTPRRREMDEHTTRSEKKHTHTKHSRIETLRIPIQDDVHPTPTGGRDYAVFHPEVYPNDGHGAYPIIDFALL
jgi:hypothetical protein